MNFRIKCACVTSTPHLAEKKKERNVGEQNTSFCKACGKITPQRLVAPEKGDAKPGIHVSERYVLSSSRITKSQHTLRAARTDFVEIF